MARIIETTVYKYEELSPEAQEKARDWWREGGLYYDWWQFTKEEFESDLAALGFENVTSQFSGFWSQGDGACFDFKGLDLVKLATAPTSTLGHTMEGIVEEFRAEHKQTLRHVVRARGVFTIASYKNSYATHYCHARTRGISLELDDFCSNTPHRLHAAADKFEAALDALCKKLADHFYRVLESEYEYLNEDAQVSEAIIANEYEFLEDGSRA